MFSLLRSRWSILAALLVLTPLWAQTPAPRAGAKPSAAGNPAVEAQPRAEQTMDVDVKDTDIRDVIRMISTGYNLNIVMDKEVTGKVTLHLSKVPIMEGLRTVAQSQGLEVVKEGNVYRIRTATAEQRSAITYIRGKLTVDVQNVDVREFLRELSSKAAVSIVPDGKVQGQISGKLYQVDLDAGLRALLEGNGFAVTKLRNIYQVSAGGSSFDGGDGGGGRRGSSRPSTGSSKASFYVNYHDGLLSLDVTNGDLGDVIKAVTDQSDIEVVTYENLRGEVNAKLNDAPLADAFALLLGGTRFTFIQKGKIILIGDRNPATPSGEALSTSELLHLRHIKADNVPNILPKNVQAQNIKVVKEQNALLVSGTSEDIVNTRDFLNTVDIPTPQVIIDVLVVEYIRELDRDMGLEWGVGSGGTPTFSAPYLSGSGRIIGLEQALFKGRQFWKGFGQLTDTFYVKLRLMEKQGKARVLAQPSITVLNGNKATIDVGQTQYFKIVAGTHDNPTYQFRPISFGITLNITPWISQGGQITAEIAPEISNDMGVNEEGYPNVFKRSVNTTVRLDDRQTLILGGLLRRDNQVTEMRVPILADIPIIGNLFKTSLKKDTQTNLVIYITPRVLRQDGGVDLESELNRLESTEKVRFNGTETFVQTLKRSSVRDILLKDSVGVKRSLPDSSTDTDSLLEPPAPPKTAPQPAQQSTSQQQENPAAPSPAASTPEQKASETPVAPAREGRAGGQE